MEKKDETTPSVTAKVSSNEAANDTAQVGELIQLEGIDVALAEKMRLVNDVCLLGMKNFSSN